LRAREELEEGNESDMRGPPGSERERGGRKLGRGDVLGRKKENEPWGFAGRKRKKKENWAAGGKERGKMGWARKGKKEEGGKD
jgi:hypothetical protein